MIKDRQGHIVKELEGQNKLLKKLKKLLTIQTQDDIIYKLSARTTRNSTESVRSKRNLKINEKSC